MLVLSGGSCTTARADHPLEPIANRARVFYHEIYDLASRGVRLPVDLARPIIVRTALNTWVRGLPLEKGVRKRILDRIDSPDLLDEVVPFLLSLKETYLADGDSVESFDAFFRRTWSAADRVPGIEHSMFSWQESSTPESAGAATGFVLDEETAARIVTFYDALYPSSGPRAPRSEGLRSCDRGDDPLALRAAVERARPIVREIISELRPRLDLDPELDAAVQATLDDPARLETVTTTGIEFIDHFVCSSYRVFANGIRREVELRRWMRRQLDEPGGGDLFSYLRFANDERRYAALIVVDGLQGHLVEALASGGGGPFLDAVRLEQQRAGGAAPPTQPSRRAPEVETRFLTSLATRSFDDPRYLPFFRDLYDDGGESDSRRPHGVAQMGIATTPTISVRNLPMVKTGATVAGSGGTGIPNFHFVDRSFRRAGESPDQASGRPYYFFGNDAMRLTPLTREAGMRSLFDRLPRLNSFSCAAQYDDEAHYRIDALVNLALGESLRDFAETLCISELTTRARNERRLRKLRTHLLDEQDSLTREIPVWRIFRVLAQRDERALAERAIDEIARLEQRTVPELLLYYNPWPDHFAHFKGPFGDEILAPSGELARLDYWIGQLSRVYRRAGVEQRTLFGMAGDHGLAPVFHLVDPEALVFDALREEGVDLRVSKISSDEGEGPKLNSLFDPPAMRGYDAVVASTAGGNYMLDFFVDANGPGWSRQPLYRELVTLELLASHGAAKTSKDAAKTSKDAAKTSQDAAKTSQDAAKTSQDAAKTSQAGREIDILSELVSRLSESLDYLAVREAASGADGGETRLIGTRPSERGPRRADGWILRRGDRIFYRYDRADLLDTDRLTPYERLSPAQRAEHAALRERCVDDASREVPETWCRESDWRQLTRYTPRPDSVVQLAHLYDVDRAGSVNLFPRSGIAYNSRVPGRHAGESFHEKDAFVGLWGAPVTRGPDAGRIDVLVNGSLAGALYEHLTGERPFPGENGWGFPAIGPELFAE